MDQDGEGTRLAQRHCLIELSFDLTRLAAGPQRLHPPGPGLHRRGCQQKGGICARIPPARRQLPALGDGPLPAQPEPHQRRDLRQTPGAAMAEHGAGAGPLRAGRRDLALGGQRKRREARPRDGVRRRCADAGDAGSRSNPPRAPARDQGARDQRGRHSDPGEREIHPVPQRTERPGIRRALHQGQAGDICLPRVPVADPPHDLQEGQ